jgi:hypothetical protein
LIHVEAKNSLVYHSILSFGVPFLQLATDQRHGLYGSYVCVDYIFFPHLQGTNRGHFGNKSSWTWNLTYIMYELAVKTPKL